jgi:hypothetical protein
MGVALLLLGMLAFEDPPKDVIDFFRSVAATLADAGRDVNTRERGRARDAAEFLEHFDKAMPGYAEFSGQIQAMVGAGDVSTTIDFINTEGDGQKRTLDLDWLLLCEGEGPKRAVIKCTIEKRGRKWKITSIAPIDFFKRE